MRLPGRSTQGQASVRRIAVATDRSETADRGAAWAAEIARRFEAELVIVQVLVDGAPDATHDAGLRALAGSWVSRMRRPG